MNRSPPGWEGHERQAGCERFHAIGLLPLVCVSPDSLRTYNGMDYDRAHETDGQGAAAAMPVPREVNVEPIAGRRARRPRGSLTREAVVDAALALVDAEGIDALSMP